MGRLFGTDGVRGIANEKLNCELAYRLGQAGAHVLTNGAHKARILIGRDTRISGEMLEAALAAGICSVGVEAVSVGVAPTPAIAYLSKHTYAAAGIMISASHNPYEYNGIKFFDGNGCKLKDGIQDRIENIILDNTEKMALGTGVGIGRRVFLEEPLEKYKEFLLSAVNVRLDGLKIVLDCSNGAASLIAPAVFSALGAQTITYYNTPDGCNINDQCGSTHPEKLARLVTESGADIGLAFDGDADRLIAMDEYGVMVDGDTVLAICAIDLKEHGLLVKNTLVSTVESNLGLELCMKEHGIRYVRTDVGDRRVLEEMLENGYIIGGEQSGHIIFLEYNTTGDGMLAGIQLAGVMVRNKKPLSELSTCIKLLPQVLVNARVSEEKKYGYKDDEEINAAIEKLENEFSGKGRVLIRASGTEPMVRVMIEGDDKAAIEKEAWSLASLIEKKLK